MPSIPLVMVLLVCSFALEQSDHKDDDQTTTDSVDSVKHKSYLLYTRFFLERRREQLKGTAELRMKDDYARQFEIVKRTMETIFKVLNTSWMSVNESDLEPPRGVMPDEPSNQEVVGTVLENTAFVGDFAIQLPEITNSILRRNREWKTILRWAVEFCNQSSVYQENETHMLHLKLLAQEVGFVPPDPNLQNPFRLNKEEEVVEKDQKQRSRKKKAIKKRGPSLRRARHEL